MHRKWFKFSVHALDACASSVHKVYHMDGVIHRYRVRRGKCIADCIDKLTAVQSGSLNFTVFCFFQCFLLADDVFIHPFRIAVPLNIFHSMLNVDRTRQTIHAKASPVPELKGEDVRSCADLQHHRIFS